MSLMNYSLSRPSVDAVVAAFGGARAAADKTGGDIPTLCYLLNNPSAIPPDGFVAGSRGEMYSELVKRADQDEVCAAWDGQEAERKTVAEVMRSTGMGFQKAKRILVDCGRIKP